MALTTAEGKGMISHSYQQFVMGHSGDIERTYTLSKCRLPQEMVEDMRLAAKRFAQFLETGKKMDAQDYIKALRENILTDRGVPPEEYNKLDLAGMSNEEFNKYLRSKEKKEDIASERANVSETNVQGNEAILPPSNSKLKREGKHATFPLGQLPQILAYGARYVDKYTDENGRQIAIVEI